MSAHKPYFHQEYPKWITAGGRSFIVQDEEEHALHDPSAFNANNEPDDPVVPPAPENNVAVAVEFAAPAATAKPWETAAADEEIPPQPNAPIADDSRPRRSRK